MTAVQWIFILLGVTVCLSLVFRPEVPDIPRVPNQAWPIKPNSLLLRRNPWKPCLKQSYPSGSTGWIASGRACLYPVPPAKQSSGRQVTSFLPMFLTSAFRAFLIVKDIPHFRNNLFLCTPLTFFTFAESLFGVSECTEGSSFAKSHTFCWCVRCLCVIVSA